MENQIIIHGSGNQNRIALLEDGELAQLFIESDQNERTVGNIYVAKVHKVMSGIRAAFIDMGTPKDAFLHFSDAGDHLRNYIQMLNGPDAIKKNVRKELDDINFDKLPNHEKQVFAGKMLQPGQKLLVQIVKEPIGSKGPRISTDITIAGRMLVLIPMGEYIAVSRKINNNKERRRLKNIVSSILPDDFGVIIRTVAEGQSKKAIEEDMRDVLKNWEEILTKLKTAEPPELLYKDLGMTESLIRDLFAKQYDRILIDDPGMFNTIKSYVSQVAPQMLPNVELHKSREHIFDYMNIAKDVDSIFSPRVRMPSGGYLIFEQTEAMYVVDVNSGPYAAKKTQEKNSLKTNLEAAREVAKQLRLRDIGGIIVVDFIDQRKSKNKKKIYDELKKEFKKDPAKTNVIGMSDFGIVQITRQRIRPSVVNSVSNVCPTCGGTGTVVTRNTIIADLDAWLSKFANNTPYRAVDIYINPYLKSHLEKGFFSQRRKWMFRYLLKITLVEDETASLNEYKATLAGSDIDITDAVMQNKDLDKLINEEEENPETEAYRRNSGNLDYYTKNRDELPPRPSSKKHHKKHSGHKSKKSKSYN
ncbi:MAG TPA: Rne/Rng family ribonuclease [Balneolaceae bacterium]|nr:Rne/Rng family ribonuclease [Balneolaceae bacterium]